MRVHKKVEDERKMRQVKGREGYGEEAGKRKKKKMEEE